MNDRGRRFANEDDEAQYFLGVLREGTREAKIEARERLAQIFEARGMLAEACELLERNIWEGVRQSSLFFRLARLYRSLGQGELAARATADGDQLQWQELEAATSSTSTRGQSERCSSATSTRESRRATGFRNRGDHGESGLRDDSRGVPEEADHTPINYASKTRRSMAFIVDLLLIALANIPVYVVIIHVFEDTNTPKILENTAPLLTHVFVMILYGSLLEFLPFNATFGKAIFGIRVANQSGLSPSLGQVIGRNIVKSLTGPKYLFWIFSAIAIWRDERSRAWHDRAAGTVVMRRATVNSGLQPIAVLFTTFAGGVLVFLAAYLAWDSQLASIGRDTETKPMLAAPTPAPTQAPTPAAAPKVTIPTLRPIQVPTFESLPIEAILTPRSTPVESTVVKPALGTLYVWNTDNEGVYLRKTPNLNDRIRAYTDRTRMDIIGSPVRENDINWTPVRAPDGQEGYIPSEYLIETLPIEPSATAVSLANGAYITPPHVGRGLGELTIRNGTSHDAVAKLVLNGSSSTRAQVGQTLYFVFIKARNAVTIRQIAAGSYRLRFASGSDWDNSSKKFRRDASFSEFVDPLNYFEIPIATGTRYSVFEVTLNPVIGGTAQTTSIDEARFAQD